jgi:hypothetical protein
MPNQRVCKWRNPWFTISLEDPDHIDRPLYRMPFAATLGAWCAAISLGIARAATDTLFDLGCSKMSVAGAGTSRSAGGSGDGGVLDSRLGGRTSAPA